jgi:hypothetical protein
MNNNCKLLSNYTKIELLFMEDKKNSIRIEGKWNFTGNNEFVSCSTSHDSDRRGIPRCTIGAVKCATCRVLNFCDVF